MKIKNKITLLAILPLIFGSSRFTGKCISDFEKEVGCVPVAICHALDNFYLVVHSLQTAGM